MILKSVRVRGLRSVRDETLHCDRLTVLVGANGAGKSTLLRAIELFEAETPRLSNEDCFGREGGPVEVSLTFGDLSQEASGAFKSYVRDGALTVTRILSPGGGKGSHPYHADRMQHPAFVEFRRTGPADEQKKLYAALRKDPAFAALPSATTKSAMAAALEQFEDDHVVDCVPERDAGTFFGFADGMQGRLGQYVRFVSIPAVRDAGDASLEGKASPITQILDIVVRGVIRTNPEIESLKEEIQDRYVALLRPDKVPQLHSTAKQLTARLSALAPGSELSLEWAPVQLELPMPKAAVSVSEHGYATDVERCGHGVQRAVIMSLLQELADTKNPGATQTNASHLVLLLEEPELFQHPSRQRHLARVLDQLASAENPSVQVIYATHSPLFVGLDRFDSIRLLRREPGDAPPYATTMKRLTLEQVCETLKKAASDGGPQYTESNLRTRLHSLMTPWVSEGFFADLVVLVEGEDDRAAILGYAAAAGIDCDNQGIAVIPVGGKTSLDRPYVVFRDLGIPTYIVWDADKGKNDPRPDVNRYLLRLVGDNEEDYPSGVHAHYACFEVELETTLKTELGKERYRQLVDQVKVETGAAKDDDVCKRPALFELLARKAKEIPAEVPSLKSILEAIVAARQHVV